MDTMRRYRRNNENFKVFIFKTLVKECIEPTLCYLHFDWKEMIPRCAPSLYTDNYYQKLRGNSNIQETPRTNSLSGVNKSSSADNETLSLQ